MEKEERFIQCNSQRIKIDSGGLKSFKGLEKMEEEVVENPQSQLQRVLIKPFHA